MASDLEVQELEDTIERQAALIEKLTSALEPFAAAAAGFNEVPITVGDLLNASAALAAARKGKGE